jgi:uncharacterized protein YktA (UPF0223 family)
MVNYQDTKIYSIEVGDMVYIGHSAEKYLSGRESKHKCAFRKGSKYKVYEAMRKVGMTADDIICVWLEDYPCNSVEEAKARERVWYDKTDKDKLLNSYRPFRSQEEIEQRQQEWRVANRDKVSEQNKRKAKNNPEKTYERNHKMTHCDICDCDVLLRTKVRHERSIKHAENMKQISLPTTNAKKTN